MKIQNKLHLAFAIVGITSSVIALIRIALGHDVQEVVTPNMIIGAICLAGMMIIHYTERKKNHDTK